MVKNNLSNFSLALFTPIAVLFIAISAQLSINLPEDVSMVPITGQSFAVLILAHIMKEKWAFIIVFLYLLIGVLGAPVFSDFSSGIDSFTGPSMGYLIGFLPAVLITGTLASKQGTKFSNLLVQMLLGTLIILICGYLGLFRFLDPSDAFIKGVKPYLLGAFVKIMLAVILLAVFYKLKALMNNKIA